MVYGLAYPLWWRKACFFLARRDEVLQQLIHRIGEGECLVSIVNPFVTIVKAVVGQQISLFAANAVFARIVRVMHYEVTARRWLELLPAVLQSVGLSGRKVRCIHDVACFFAAEQVDFEYFQDWSDQEVTILLTRFNGIGLWTVHMFLIFSLLRPHVVSRTDVAFIKAVQHLYQDSRPPFLQHLADLWSPWGTAATWFMWRFLDPVVVQY